MFQSQEFFYFSLTNPAKFIGKKPRKYTVPVPVQQDGGSVGGGTASGVAGSSGAETSLPPGASSMTPAIRSTRSSGRGGRCGGGGSGGVDPIAAQAAAAAQVRTYRDNGVKHSASAYNRVCVMIVVFFITSASLKLGRFHRMTQSILIY